MKNPRRPHRFVLVSPIVALVALLPLAGSAPASATCATQFASVALPPETAGSYLISIATAGTDSAWAVGPSLSNRTSVALHWDGSSWANTALPQVAHESDTLIGVAEITDTDVWATGLRYARAASPPVANASHVSFPLGFPDPLRTTSSLHGSPRREEWPLALHWDGSAWTSAGVPMPSHARSGLLDRVAATSPTDVWAVGSVQLRSRGWQPSTLIEHWDGSAWSVVPSPNLGVHSDQLIGVDAISADDAWAVGTRGPGFGVHHALAEHWDGTAWSAVRVRLRQGVLADVSGSGATDVWAVGLLGTRHGSGVALHWDGTAWSRSAIPDLGLNQYLEGVSVRSSSDAYAVGAGADLTGGSQIGRILHWDGATWSTQSVEVVGTFDALVGVAAGVSGVWAVGDSADPAGVNGLVETLCA